MKVRAAFLLACTFEAAWFTEANVMESYTIECKQECQKNEYKTGCNGVSLVGKCSRDAIAHHGNF